MVNVDPYDQYIGDEGATMTAAAAASTLGISLATLYAYVSRGLIRSSGRPGSRTRAYRRDDVEALARRRRDRSGRERGAAGALDWGMPVLASAITRIHDGRLRYRSVDAIGLARTASLEEAASLLWAAGDGRPFGGPAPAVRLALLEHLAAARPLERCMAILPLAADPRALDGTPDGLRRTAAGVLRLAAAALAGVPPSAAPVHLVLAQAWADPAVGQETAADLVRRALVLAADHELNASAFAARVAASTGAPPHHAVAAGLAALAGPRHGGMTLGAAALLADLAASPRPMAAVAERLRRGETLPGFGHPLYPAGDPRGSALLEAVAAAFPDHRPTAAILAGVEACRTLSGLAPNIDAGLAAVALALGFPGGAAIGLFAAGRTAGWLAHAMEQAASGVLIRPRARYVGE
jgi:citrate synthase